MLYIVLQQMKSHGINPIYYHNTKQSRLELDFIIQQEKQALPIEVKAETNVRSNALSALLKEKPEMKALRFSMLPYKRQEQLTNIPLYAVNDYIIHAK